MSCTLREKISKEFQDPNKKAPFMISSAFGGFRICIPRYFANSVCKMSTFILYRLLIVKQDISVVLLL